VEARCRRPAQQLIRIRLFRIGSRRLLNRGRRLRFAAAIQRTIMIRFIGILVAATVVMVLIWNR
jgi:hypothetical protein